MDPRFDSLGGIGGRVFDDPLLMHSNQALPDSLESALSFARFLYLLSPQYRQASTRVRSYFVTDFDYEGGSDAEQREWDDYLHDQLNLLGFLREVGDEEATYGNAFIRIHFPFDRFLVDPEGGAEYALDFFKPKSLRFNLKRMTYSAPHPKNGNTVEFKFRDRKSLDASRIRLRRLPPEQITLDHVALSGSTRFVYRFDTTTIDDVKRGRLHTINELPMDMLKAISLNADFLFYPGTIFHLKAPDITGISNKGWGIPGTLLNFPNIYQIQAYRKIDQALAMDYMLPFRLFTPCSMDKITDALNMIIMPQWVGQIQQIIDNRRKDKFAMHALPFPVTYQEFGAQGKQLTPYDLAEFHTNALLDGMGFPQELFKGTVAFVQMPTALRLFENSFSYVGIGFNSLVHWVTNSVRSYLGYAKMRTRLQRPSVADSIERKQFVYQLAAMGEISRETAYESLGVDDTVAEFRKRLQEDMGRQREQVKAQQELQKEIESGAIMAQAPAGGAGQPMGGSMPGASPSGGPQVTPLDVQGDAQQLAEYWLSIPTDGERTKAMQAVSTTKPELHAMAKELMDRIRRSGESQGRQQVAASYQQGGAPA